MKKLFAFLFALMVLGGNIVGQGISLIGQKVAQGMKFLEQGLIDLGKLPFLNREKRRDKAFQSKILGVMLCNEKGASFKGSVLGRTLYNTRGGLSQMGVPSRIKGMELLNANGDINYSGMGFQYIMDTLSYIRAEVSEQKFYRIPIADYIPVDVGEAAWSDEVVNNLVFQTGGGFFDGDIDQGQGGQRMASVDAMLAPVRMPVRTWAKAANWTIIEIAQAAERSKWDIVASKLESLKTNWDLGLQQVAFLGHPSVSGITGLYNNAAVNINTSLLPTTFAKMSTTQFQAFVAGAVAAYFTNSNNTEYPDTYVMPATDYLALAAAASPTYPLISQMTYMLNAFREITGNPNFKIKGLIYGSPANNTSAGIGKQRHVLYRNDPKTMKMAIPVDFTMLEADTSNKFNWQQPAYGQYSGTLIMRPREVLYMDVQAS